MSYRCITKFLHMIPIKTKSGPFVASAFRSIFNDPKCSKRQHRPICIRTDKGKEFLNKHFKDMLRVGRIQFQVCRNPDLKCAVVERVYRTIRDKIYKYFTHKNMYRYIDVLPKFFKTYNDMVHSTTGMANSRLTDSYVPSIWKRMEEARRGAVASRKQQRRLGGATRAH